MVLLLGCAVVSFGASATVVEPSGARALRDGHGDPECFDSRAWRFVRETDGSSADVPAQADCTFIAADPSARCPVVSYAPASVACARTCGGILGDALDSPTWYWNDKIWKDCTWVASNPGERCAVIGRDAAADACASSCGNCAPGSAGGGEDAPVGESEACADSSSWYAKKPSKDCAWVAKKASKRCKKTDQFLASDACPESCGGSGSDSETWYTKQVARGCAWVARNPDRFCDRSGKDPAATPCALSCGQCPATGAPTVAEATAPPTPDSWGAGSAWVQVGADIDPPGTGIHEEIFGFSIALQPSGNRVVVAAPYSDGYRGTTRIYDWEGGGWALKYEIPGEDAGDHSGSGLAISDDGSVVAIGASNNERHNPNDLPATDDDWAREDMGGHVRVFELLEGGEAAQLGGDIDGDAMRDLSGNSIALSAAGDVLSIGAYRADIDCDAAIDDFACDLDFGYGPGLDGGHVRVFKWDGSDWEQHGQTLDGEATLDSYGWSVDLSKDGRVLAVGTDRNDGPGSNYFPFGDQFGHVRLFAWQPAGFWEPMGSEIDGEFIEDSCGYDVALSASGETVVVGCPGFGAGWYRGATRVYDWVGTAWVKRGADIEGQWTDDMDGFSVAVSADGNTVATGAPYFGLNPDGTLDGNGWPYGRGRARVWRWLNNGWVNVGGAIEGLAVQDNFGWRVALDDAGTRVAISARYHDSGAGHVRVFQWE